MAIRFWDVRRAASGPGQLLLPFGQFTFTPDRRWQSSSAEKFPSLRGHTSFACPKEVCKKTTHRGGAKTLLPQRHAPSPMYPSRTAYLFLPIWVALPAPGHPGATPYKSTIELWFVGRPDPWPPGKLLSVKHCLHTDIRQGQRSRSTLPNSKAGQITHLRRWGYIGGGRLCKKPSPYAYFSSPILFVRAKRIGPAEHTEVIYGR